jgi:ABC-type glutathione transport system ATPase component
MSALLEVENLTIKAKLRLGESFIVRGLSFVVNARDRLGIIGESGGGKTMTALSLFGLLPGNCRAFGTARLGGRDLLSLGEKEIRELRGRELVLIPQSGGAFLNPVFTVRSHLKETLRRSGIRAVVEKKSIELLSRAGFADPADALGKYPFQLSGGMAQRVVLAIGLAAAPKLVVADEPTRGIDEESADLFLEELDRAFPEAAVIIITHNMGLAKRCNRLLVLHDGGIVEYGDSENILRAPAHPYTQSLIDALPERGFHASIA